MAHPSLSPAHRGAVTLVGAGPGSVDLLTLGAARALAVAEVVVHDRLVSSEILALASPDARLIAVGKRKGSGWLQEDINQLLIDEANTGHRVVRLKGGDPFLYGRGSEEVRALRSAGIPVDVIPGVSSALAAPALAGIAVTSRGVSNACTILSGHLIDDTAYDWSALARVPGTLVVLMGVTTARALASQLLAHGKPTDEPVAIVQAAGTDHQQTAYTDLATLAVDGCPLESPAVIVIGAVASPEAVEPVEASPEATGEVFGPRRGRPQSGLQTGEAVGLGQHLARTAKIHEAAIG